MTLVLYKPTSEIKDNTILPTIEIEVRAKHQDATNAFYSWAMCELYVGKDFEFHKIPLVNSVAAMINQRVNAQSDFSFKFDVVITQEIQHRLSKLIGHGQDAHFILRVVAQLFDTDGDHKIIRANVLSDNCRLKINMSEWVKVSTKWGKDYILIPLSPTTHEKMIDLRRLYKHLPTDDDLIDELMRLHTKDT
jgi:hypothetical protein